MVVRNTAVLVRAGHAVVAVNLLGAEVFDAIEGHQVAAIEGDILLQDLTALKLAEDVLVDGAELVGMNVVEDLTHLGVAGDAVQAEDRTEVVVEGTAAGGEERGILEGKEGEAGQQGVGQGERRAAPLPRESLEPLADTLDQGVEVKMAALPPQSNRLAHDSPSGWTGATGIVYESRSRRSRFFKLFSDHRELLPHQECRKFSSRLE